MKNRHSYYIDTEGIDKLAIAKGLKFLQKICIKSNPTYSWLVILTKDKLKSKASIIVDVLTERIANALLKDTPIKLEPSDTYLKLATERTIESENVAGPVLVIHPTKELLDKLDDLWDVTDIIVIPWRRDEIQQWINTWNAQDIERTENTTKSSIISNPVVEKALVSLCSIINVSTGIMHLSDKDRTIDLFDLLKEENEPYDCHEIRSYLIKNNWFTEHADGLVKIAEAVQQGKRIRRGNKVWNRNIINEWRKN